MKWCASAAVVLAGWYLMVAPERPDRLWGWFYRATGQERPLSDWETIQSYDSAADCQQLRHDFQQLAVAIRGNNSTNGRKHSPSDKELDAAFEKLYERLAPNVDGIDDLTAYFLLLRQIGRKAQSDNDWRSDANGLSTRWIDTRCIATDDPRLAK